jgi:hypothetical protein
LDLIRINIENLQTEFISPSVSANTLTDESFAR